MAWIKEWSERTKRWFYIFPISGCPLPVPKQQLVVDTAFHGWAGGGFAPSPERWRGATERLRLIKISNFREKFKIYIEKSQWIIAFLLIFSPIFQDFCHFILFCNISKFWGVRGVVLIRLGCTFEFGGLYNPWKVTSTFIPSQIHMKCWKP